MDSLKVAKYILQEIMHVFNLERRLIKSRPYAPNQRTLFVFIKFKYMGVDYSVIINKIPERLGYFYVMFDLPPNYYEVFDVVHYTQLYQLIYNVFTYIDQSRPRINY